MKTDEMADETTGNDNGVPPRRPYWPVGLALFALVIVLLGAAFVLNARLRPAVGFQSVARTAVTASPVSTVSATPAVSNVAPAATLTPVPGTPTVVTTPALPSGAHFATTPLEREIEAAYMQYWKVRSAALLNRDDSHLSDVMAGPELARAEKQIQDLKTQGRAVKVDIQHEMIAFGHVSADRADLYDEYLNRSVYVDPVTKQEIPTKAPAQVEKILHTMEKINGTWKVVDGAQESN